MVIGVGSIVGAADFVELAEKVDFVGLLLGINVRVAVAFAVGLRVGSTVSLAVGALLRVAVGTGKIGVAAGVVVGIDVDDDDGVESMGARVGVFVDFNDGVAVVDAEMGSSFSVGVTVGALLRVVVEGFLGQIDG
eukprot:CAMPEP_0119033218 /NCGR_PEP_ID=MMETSP1177-20130426/241_1 /TAXON_ID=2985 /ORGANISM="Ochromonas sp, Strain CCMP1899" /LENGTH=134 /DNA_ID=CAMNT_0006989779 /DNA_START=210 /DNA_END=614 /DNA_ORIENTATION=-